MTTPTSNSANHLHGVWGSSSTDVFAVGDYGTILHYGESVTTTTVPVTTTTTTTPGGVCPAITVMGADSNEINRLRVFRNEMFSKTSSGKQYTALYYKHALELSAIFARNRELREQSKQIIQALMPTITGYINHKKTFITEDIVQESLEMIDGLRVQASPALEQDLTHLKQDIQNGGIFKTFGMKIQKN